MTHLAVFYKFSFASTFTTRQRTKHHPLPSSAFQRGLNSHEFVIHRNAATFTSLLVIPLSAVSSSLANRFPSHPKPHLAHLHYAVPCGKTPVTTVRIRCPRAMSCPGCPSFGVASIHAVQLHQWSFSTLLLRYASLRTTVCAHCMSPPPRHAGCPIQIGYLPNR